ncbi:MAG TPA: endonuclease III [Buchnera sp. (in: enterobacteria)]|nr:endonuclease III [Buchnera sp. (in: enterobacteria)]
MNKKKRYNILKIFNNKKSYFRTKLIFSSAFECLISVMLSAQSTDINVNKATKKLYMIANTPQDILFLGTEDLKHYVKKIGLYNNKSKNIINTCHILLHQYDGKVPDNRESLEQLPGVGRKTANVVLNLVFNWSTIAVDTHVFRVSNRTNFVTGKTVKEVEKKLLVHVPIYFILFFHNWFVQHGRYICTARRPKCKICCIKNLCEFENKVL